MGRDEIKQALENWISAWNSHDLEQVMELFHNDVVFEHWVGRTINGKHLLRSSWREWFNAHGDFRFTREDIFIDEDSRKALFQWLLEWPSLEKSVEGMKEIRRGVDVLYFRDGKILRKLTYSKTTIEIGGKKIVLTADL